MERADFLKTIDAIRDLPTLPQVALDINRLLDNPGATIGQVSDTIRKDQAIVPKILRLVNSSFFGLEKQVSTISRAVVILGFKTVRNAIVSVSIIDALKGARSERIDFNSFWRHAISCAVISKHIAQSSRLGAPEDAFTAGLIHDIGKLVLAKYFPDQFVRIQEKVESGQTFYDSEIDVIPVHHNEIGAYLTRRWRLPPLISDAVHYSHGVFDYDAFPLASVVFCAEEVLNRNVLEDPGDPKVDLPCSGNMDSLRTLMDNVDMWLPVVKDDIENACLFLMEGSRHGR